MFINNWMCFILQFGFLFKGKKIFKEIPRKMYSSCANFLNVYPNFFWFFSSAGRGIGYCLCGYMEDGRKGHGSSLEIKLTLGKRILKWGLEKKRKAIKRRRIFPGSRNFTELPGQAIPLVGKQTTLSYLSSGNSTFLFYISNHLNNVQMISPSIPKGDKATLNCSRSKSLWFRTTTQLANLMTQGCTQL